MSDLTVAQHTLQHRLNDIPESTSTHVKMGFTLLPKLTSTQLEEVVSYVISNMSKQTRYEPEVASVMSGVDKNIVGDLLSAVAITVGAVFDIDVSKEDFFSFAPEGLIDAHVRPYVEQVLSHTIAQRDEIKSDIERSKLANAILPSFRFIDSNIDIRIKFDDEGNICDKVPLAIFHIATDIDEDIIFQASPSDIDELIMKFERARGYLKKALS